MGRSEGGKWNVDDTEVGVGIGNGWRARHYMFKLLVLAWSYLVPVTLTTVEIFAFLIWESNSKLEHYG